MIIARAYRKLESSPFHGIKMIYVHYQLLGGSGGRINSQCRNDIAYIKAHHGSCSDDKTNLLFSTKDFQQTTSMIVVWDMIYISCSAKKADHEVTLFYPACGGMECGCNTLTWVSSHSNYYPWGFTSPPKSSSTFIRIYLHWLLVEYGQHSPETCQVPYLQQDILRREQTRGSWSTMSLHIDEWMAITWRDFTSGRLGSTRPIMVRLQSVHLWMAIDELVNWSSNLTQCTWCATTLRYSWRRNYRPLEVWSDMYSWSNTDKGL